MSRTSVLFCCAGVFLSGCRPGYYVIPRPTVDPVGNWTGTGYYTSEEEKERKRLIPPSLLRDRRLYTAARNCAEMHNEALDGLQLCTIASSILRPGAITAGLWASLSTGISASMGTGEDMAKRRWEWSALASSLIGAALGAIELFTNCSDRRELQAMVVMRRATAIANAAHMVDCADQVNDREARAGQLLQEGLERANSAIAEWIKSPERSDVEDTKLEWLKRALKDVSRIAQEPKQAQGNANASDEKMRKWLNEQSPKEEKLKWLSETLKRIAENYVTDAGKAKGTPAEAEAKRRAKDAATAAAASEEALREVEVLLCANPSGGKESTSASYFMDEAHRVLTQCLNSEYVNLGAPSATGK